MKLSLYLNDTAAMINDPTYSFVSQFQMTRWINEARRLLAIETGCIRRLISGQSAFGAQSQAGSSVPSATQPDAVPQGFNFGLGSPVFGGDFSSDFNSDFSIGGGGSSAVIGSSAGPLQTIPGAERYPYVGFINPYLQQQHAGCDKVLDTIAVANSWGGVSKPTLDWMPWDEFQAYCRSYALLNQSYPAVWSVYNDGPLGEIWIFPIPSQANDLEFDCTVTPKPLYSDSDFDAIPPDTFDDNIKYGAAALCYLMTKRPAMAQVMAQESGLRTIIMRTGADRGKTRTYYPSGP